jgi:hypothetical protein
MKQNAFNRAANKRARELADKLASRDRRDPGATVAMLLAAGHAEAALFYLRQGDVQGFRACARNAGDYALKF